MRKTDQETKDRIKDGGVASSDKWRGHQIHYAELGACWVYSSDNLPVSQDPSRACGECGLGNTPEGHDGCLGTLPGVMNACCGHGVEPDAYIQYLAGGDVRGAEAVRVIEAAMKGGAG